jgi:hypothetical protein
MTEEIKFDTRLLVCADSYQKWVESVLPQVKKMKKINFTYGNMLNHGIKIGDKFLYYRILPKTHNVWRYETMFSFMPSELIPNNQMVERKTCLKIYQGKKKGEVSFTDEIAIPVLADECGDPWMSLTPMEVISQRSGIKRAKGTVLIGGCGMGWFARRVLERKKVSHVTICDIDKHVLSYFGGQLKREYKDRVTLLHSDIYEVDAYQYDSYLSDIWMGVNDKPWDDKFQEIKFNHKNAWGWGYSI